MNVEGQYNPKDVECIPVENLEVLPSGADWQSRHLESERRKAEIRDRIHKQTEQGQKTAKDYFRPAKPTPSIYDSDLKRVALRRRVPAFRSVRPALPAKNRFLPLKTRLYITPKRLQKRKTGICRIFTAMKENRVLHCGNGMRLSA